MAFFSKIYAYNLFLFLLVRLNVSYNSPIKSFARGSRICKMLFFFRNCLQVYIGIPTVIYEIITKIPNFY